MKEAFHLIYLILWMLLKNCTFWQVHFSFNLSSVGTILQQQILSRCQFIVDLLFTLVNISVIKIPLRFQALPFTHLIEHNLKSDWTKWGQNLFIPIVSSQKPKLWDTPQYWGNPFLYWKALEIQDWFQQQSWAGNKTSWDISNTNGKMSGSSTS